MSYKISKISKSDDGVSEVVLSGLLVVTNASKIKTELNKLKFKTKEAKVVVSDVDDFDLSMAQLLKAFIIKNKKNNIKVSCDFQLNDDLNVLLNRSGILKELNQ